MKTVFNQSARKRPVNLTLNEDLVRQAKDMTDNLSSVVECLLAEYVTAEHMQRLANERSLNKVVAAWNHFGAKHGSFADDYSSL
jgi:antitoxin CcdA